MPKIIVPVGFDKGPYYPADGGKGSEAEYFGVVNHSRLATLPKDAYSVWFTTFIDPKAHIELTFTRERLIELAARDDIDVELLVQRLIKTGVLLEYDTDSDEALEVLRTHKLYAMAEGMGSTDEVPEDFRIGKIGNVLLEVRYEVYHIWAGSFHDGTIWDAVVSFAKSSPSDAPYSTPEELGRMFARAIPMLVGARCAHLQPVS